jgi:hypothetical protein
MTKADLLKLVQEARARWDATLGEVGESRLEEPGVDGDWTVRDVIAHITWHEKEMLELLRTRTLAGSELWTLPLNERNSAIFQENRNRSLDDVLQEARQVYPQLLAEIERLEDADLTDPTRIADMPPGWKLYTLLADNTYDHYNDHSADLQAWLGVSKQ